MWVIVTVFFIIVLALGMVLGGIETEARRNSAMLKRQREDE